MSSLPSDIVSVDRNALQPADIRECDADRAAVVRQMLRLTLLAVVLLAVVLVWHVELSAFGGVFADQAQAPGLDAMLAGAAVLLLGAGMAYTWVRLAKQLLRTSWPRS